MSAPSNKTKASRNHTRKAAYAAQADKSSRNEITLDKPIVGRFEEVFEKDSRGIAHVRQVLVHDEPKVTAPAPLTETHAEYDDRPAGVVVQSGRTSFQNANTSNLPRRADGNVAKSKSDDYAPSIPTPDGTRYGHARRQASAWSRCSHAAANKGVHDYSGKRSKPDRVYPRDRCITCGCPQGGV